MPEMFHKPVSLLSADALSLLTSIAALATALLLHVRTLQTLPTISDEVSVARQPSSF